MNLKLMKLYKQQRGYSFERLSELSGVPLGTIQKIFTGETKHPREKTIQALERALYPSDSLDGLYVQEPVTSYHEKATARAYQIQKPMGAYLVEEPVTAYQVKTEDPGQMKPVSDRIKKDSEPEGAEKRTGNCLYTVEDYLAWPEDQRIELIHGKIYNMASPTILHQEIAGEIYFQLKSQIRDRGGKCRPFISPVDVHIRRDAYSLVQPDVVIVCEKSQLTNGYIEGAPDFILEVLSPSTKKKDMFIKMGLYCDAGVREYWIVDPDRQTVVAYDIGEDEVTCRDYTFEDEIPLTIYDGNIVIDMKKIDLMLS